MLQEFMKTASFALFGFLLGLRHALDADHVATISNFVSEHKSIKKSAILGIAWGIGHSLALLCVGILVIALKLTISKNVETGLEFLVGVVLLCLGIRAIRIAFNEKLHSHKHLHPDEKHEHLHYHKGKIDHAHKRTFAIGMLHGLAGSAAVMLLVLTTITSIIQGILYIAIFGIGTIIGMLLVSVLLSLPFIAAENASKFSRINETIKITVGIISILLGLFIMHENALALGLI